MAEPHLADDVDPFRLCGRLVLGRYRVLRPVGRGAQAVVYEAEHVRLRRRVALKLLSLTSPADRTVAHARFLREAEILAHLQHPSIAAVFDVETHEDGQTPLLVMEFLVGESLLKRLQRRERMPWREAFALIAQAAGALEAAHAAGVVHRDIKPDNLFVCEGGLVKVLDFGVARRLHEGEPDGKRVPRLTAVNQVLGTPAYMSPEQLRGARDLDGRTDIYSLGCVLYNLVTLRRVWPRSDYATVARLIATSRPSDVRTHASDLPEPAARVVRRAMERDRESRFQTMAQLQAALASASALSDEAASGPTASFAVTPFLDGTTAVDRAPPSAFTSLPTVLRSRTLAAPARPPPSLPSAPPGSRARTALLIVAVALAVLLALRGLWLAFAPT